MPKLIDLTGQKFGELTVLENNISFKREYTFSNLTSPNGGKLRFDFAILDENEQVIRLIEFDGLQHEQENDYFSGEFTINYNEIYMIFERKLENGNKNVYYFVRPV